MTGRGRLLLIALFGVLLAGFVAFCDSRRVVGHPKDRPHVSSYTHRHQPDEPCHDHHYEWEGDSWWIEPDHDHSGIDQTFCPHLTPSYKLSPTPVLVAPAPTSTPQPESRDQPSTPIAGDGRDSGSAATPTPTVSVVLPTWDAVVTPALPFVRVVPSNNARDLGEHGAPGIAWDHVTGMVYTITEQHPIARVFDEQAALCVARHWLWERFGPPGTPPPCQAWDLGEHGCPGWLWSGDGLWVHPIAAEPGDRFGPAWSVEEAIALIAAVIDPIGSPVSTPTPESRNQARTPDAREGRDSGLAPSEVEGEEQIDSTRRLQHDVEALCSRVHLEGIGLTDAAVARPCT